MLVVDRESEATKALLAFLRARGLEVIWARDGEAALNALDYEVSLDNAVELLTDPEPLREVLDELEAREETRELARHFHKYASQPVEQLGGITGTVGAIANARPAHSRARAGSFNWHHSTAPR